jgi:hypothetical protein
MSPIMDDSGEGRGGGWDRELAGSFSGEALLEGEWEALGLEDERDRAFALHHALISLRCALAAVELRLGELFAHFAPGGRFTFEPLGSASREAGCQARFGISWALARQFIDLARAFASLPRAREAFLLALVERSKLRWLVKVATPATEAGWLALAARRGEQQFTADVKRFREGLSADEVRATEARATPEVEEERVWVRLTGTPAQGAAVRSWVYDAMRKIAGDDKLPPWKCMELLCADVIAGMDVEIPEPPEDAAATGPRVRAVKLDDAKLRELAVRWRVQQVAKPLELPQVAEDAELEEVLGALVRCMRLRQRILAERATLLYWLDGCSLWKHLGAKTLVAYAGRALGMPPKDLREGLRLRSRLSMVPKVRAGWLRGMLSAFAARQVANIAARETEDEWLEHLEKATGKRIDTELRWHELAAHALDIAEWRRVTDGGRPQPERTMQQLRDGIESMARDCVERLDGDAPEVRAIVEQRAPLTSFGLWAPPYVAALIRKTLNEVRATGEPEETDGSTIIFLVEDLLDEISSDRPVLTREMRINFEVFKRDGWQCSNPHCRSRRNLHAHHLVFRSHGGCDEKWNEGALCAACHLRLLHKGFLRITRARPAPAEDFIFELPHVGESYREGILVMA